MTSQIHELRNRLTTAVLTATAMLDGKLPPDKTNLLGLVRALEDVKSIIVTVSKYDWDQTPAGEQMVDLRELIQSVADELALVASAADVGLQAVNGAVVPAGRCTVRGRSSEMYEAVEGAVRALLTALPARAVVTIAPRPAGIVALTVRVAGKEPHAAAYLPLIAPHLESRGGSARAGETPGEYQLRIPGTPVLGEARR